MPDNGPFTEAQRKADDIAKSVGERNAATDVVTTALLLETSDQQLTEPYTNWQKAGYEWEVKSVIQRNGGIL